ncbi:PilN domain-containing protein [Thiotrichales bacterium 19S3-7]|nr:PilN domain-containing protein [Thiotrichales bacterium 19S3-7]MCF6800786.1 PilN domain-containing protein [Thiotrichales bacterium 19S3-11]
MDLQINLMPWRNMRYQKLKKQFFIAIAIALFLAIVINFMIILVYNYQISQANKRNAYLKEKAIYYSAMAKSQVHLAKEQQELFERMLIVNQLQNTRYLTVYLFDLLPKILPDGVYLTEVSKENNHLSLYGMTESNTLIAEFMRNIIASGWMKNPKLYEISSENHNAMNENNYRRFSMTIDLATKPILTKANQVATGE